jgi:hypothetical protein
MNGQRPQGAPNGQKRKKTFLNDYRQAHPATDAPINGGKYPAQLMFEQKITGQIVLKINDGVFSEGKSTHKEVELDAYDRGQLFEALKDAADLTGNPNFKAAKVVPAKHQFVFQGGSGRMSDKPVVQCNFTITREDNGEITLGYSKGDYKAVIRFKGPRSMTVMMRNAAGEVVEDKGIMSRWAVRHWVSFMKPVLERMELEGWEPPKPRNTDGGNGGGGGGRSNDYNGGGNNNSGGSDTDFDDDF